MKGNLPRMAMHIVNIGDDQYHAFLKEITNSKGENVMIVAYSTTEHKLTVGEKDILNETPVPKELPGEKQEGPETYYTTGVPVGHAVLKVKIGDDDYYAYYVDGIDADGNDKRIVAYSIDVKVIESREEYLELQKLPSPEIEGLMTWTKTTKASGKDSEHREKFLSAETPAGNVTTVLRVNINNVVHYAYFAEGKKGLFGGTKLIVAYSRTWKNISPDEYDKLSELGQPDLAKLKQWEAVSGNAVVFSEKQPEGFKEIAKAQQKPQSVQKVVEVAQPKKLDPAKLAAVQRKPEPQPIPVPVQVNPEPEVQHEEGSKQVSPVQQSEPVVVQPEPEPVILQPEPDAQHDEGAKEGQVVPVPVQLVEEAVQQTVTVHVPVAVEQTVNPEPKAVPVQPAVVDAQPDEGSKVENAAASAVFDQPVEEPKPHAPANVEQIVKPEPDAVPVEDLGELKENIKKQVVSFFHSTPNVTEQKMIDDIASKVVENGLDYKGLTPKSLHTMIKNLIKDYKAAPAGSIREEAIREAQKVIVFDSVWKAVDSSFKVHKNDYEALRRHADKISGWEKSNLGEFIQGFKATVGTGNKISKSRLFSKDFDEAMKLHVSDPANSKLLLDSLQKDKAYDPAKLCKAYVSCMKSIQDYSLTLSKAEKAGSDAKIKTFVADASAAIKDQDINDKSLSEIRSKLIPNTEFLSSAKTKPVEFAKEFNAQFPTLYKVFEGMVDQKSAPKEMQKLVRDITNKLKVDDKKHPELDPYIRVQKMLSELEVQTRESQPEKQQDSVKNFLSFMNIDVPNADKGAQKTAQR